MSGKKTALLGLALLGHVGLGSFGASYHSNNPQNPSRALPARNAALPDLETSRAGHQMQLVFIGGQGEPWGQP